MGKAMSTIIAAMAELESALISERTAAAMEYARTHGTRTGKTIGRQRRFQLVTSAGLVEQIHKI